MRDKVFSKKEFIKAITENVKTMYRKTLKEASQQEIFQAVSLAVKDIIMDEWMATQQVIEHDDPKTVYYMSMEFLMGRALGNNLINLCAYKEVKEALEEIGLDISVIEDQEPDPALGNGGLGRLAACFMEIGRASCRKSVDLGGRRIIKKNFFSSRRRHTRYSPK